MLHSGWKNRFYHSIWSIGLALMAWTTEEKYGVSAIVSIGNKTAVDDADLLEYFAFDENTKSILIYMEV
jgi:acetyl-CoA synthetase (ADP-forming)